MVKHNYKNDWLSSQLESIEFIDVDRVIILHANTVKDVNVTILFRFLTLNQVADDCYYYRGNCYSDESSSFLQRSQQVGVTTKVLFKNIENLLVWNDFHSLFPYENISFERQQIQVFQKINLMI